MPVANNHKLAVKIFLIFNVILWLDIAVNTHTFTQKYIKVK